MGQKNSRQLKNKPEEFFHKKEKKNIGNLDRKSNI